MVHLLIVWVSSALFLYLTAAIVPGFTIKSFGSALIATVVIGFFNMWLQPIFMFMTLPLNFLTFGFFAFVVNAVILRISAGLLKGFDIDGWLPAIAGAIVLALIQGLALHFFGSTSGNTETI